MKPRYKRMVERMQVRESRGMEYASDTAVWSLYILQCSDGSLYTGVTNDVDRRLKQHQDGKASHYTRTRRPVILVYREKCGNRSQALTRECAVKALGRERKEALIAGKKTE
jgi:predicted GIY-YIG superfamily endonuclease